LRSGEREAPGLGVWFWVSIEKNVAIG